MERFFSRATMLIIFVTVVGIIAVPILGQLVFSDVVPEHWRFDKWPLWLQIPFGIIVGLYFVLEIWFLIHPPSKHDQKEESSSARKDNAKRLS
jgi:hypothetical protein